jgi:hypothetical protein
MGFRKERLLHSDTKHEGPTGAGPSSCLLILGHKGVKHNGGGYNGTAKVQAHIGTTIG